MGLFSRFVIPKPISTTPGASPLRSERFSRRVQHGGIDRPQPIGGPHPSEHKQRHDWTPKRLERFQERVDDDFGYMHAGVADKVRERIESGSGPNHHYNTREMSDMVRGLEEDHLELGLTTEQAKKIGDTFQAGPKE